MNLTEFLKEYRRILGYDHVNSHSYRVSETVSYEETLLSHMSFYNIKPEDIEITYQDSGVKVFELPARRPFYGIVGKTLNNEDTIRILRKTDRKFTAEISDLESQLCDRQLNADPNWITQIPCTKIEIINGEMKEVPVYLADDYFLNDWFGCTKDGVCREDYCHRYGWLHPNGVIEQLRFWILITTIYDKLDLLVAMTDCAESTDGATFGSCITRGMHIQGKHISILGQKDSERLYNQYLTDYRIIPFVGYTFSKDEQELLFKVCDLENQLEDAYDHVYHPHQTRRIVTEIKAELEEVHRREQNRLRKAKRRERDKEINGT